MGCCMRTSQKIKAQNTQTFNSVVNLDFEQKHQQLNESKEQTNPKPSIQSTQNNLQPENQQGQEKIQQNNENQQDFLIKNMYHTESFNQSLLNSSLKNQHTLSKSFNSKVLQQKQQLTQPQMQNLQTIPENQQPTFAKQENSYKQEILQNNFMSNSLPPITQPHRNQQFHEASQTTLLQQQKAYEDRETHQFYNYQEQSVQYQQNGQQIYGTNEFNFVMQSPDIQNQNLMHNLASRSLPPIKYQKNQSFQNTQSIREQMLVQKKSATMIGNQNDQTPIYNATNSLQQRSIFPSQYNSSKLDFSRGESEYYSMVNSKNQNPQDLNYEDMQSKNFEDSYSISPRSNFTESESKQFQVSNDEYKENQPNNPRPVTKQISYKNMPPQAQQIVNQIMDLNFQGIDQFLSQIDQVKNQNILQDIYEQNEYKYKFFSYKVKPPVIISFDLQEKKLEEYKVSEIVQFPRHSRLVSMTSFKKIFILGGTIQQPPKHQPLNTV